MQRGGCELVHAHGQGAGGVFWVSPKTHNPKSWETVFQRVAESPPGGNFEIPPELAPKRLGIQQRKYSPEYLRSVRHVGLVGARRLVGGVILFLAAGVLEVELPLWTVRSAPVALRLLELGGILVGFTFGILLVNNGVINLLKSHTAIQEATGVTPESTLRHRRLTTLIDDQLERDRVSQISVSPPDPVLQASYERRTRNREWLSYLFLVLIGLAVFADMAGLLSAAALLLTGALGLVLYGIANLFLLPVHWPPTQGSPSPLQKAESRISGLLLLGLGVFNLPTFILLNLPGTLWWPWPALAFGAAGLIESALAAAWVRRALVFPSERRAVSVD